jgi:NAD(P)-dependent dehydrogenase (short-subunit alcohol dehydrogenase family)
MRGKMVIANVTQQQRLTAVVTGAGSGLGRDIALALAAKNYLVFGTALSPLEIDDLKTASDGAVSLSQCDITDEGAVRNWVREVIARTGGGLDLLISNAGILTPGPLEVLPLSAIRREFEVNVFGVLAVVNAFLPALREQGGRILQVSTWTASFPLPFNGPSGASKAAMEAFAAVYRAELQSFGIDVVIAVAGNMKTGGPAKTASALQRVADGMNSEQRDLYGDAFETFAGTLNKMQSSGLDSQSAAKRVIELAEQKPAPSRAPVGEDAEEILRLIHEKSDAEQDQIRLSRVGLKAYDRSTRT